MDGPEDEDYPTRAYPVVYPEGFLDSMKQENAPPLLGPDVGLGFLFEASPETIAPRLAEVLKDLGYDLTNPEMVDTPIRWANVLWEFRKKPADVPRMTAFPNKRYKGIVYDRCEIYSQCSHHVLPVVGVAHIAYIMGEEKLGLSKLSRVADHFARQLTGQEDLTQDIIDYLEKICKPKGVAVFIEAKHFCKCMRGIGKQKGLMGTPVLTGVFLTDDKARTEFQFCCGRPDL